MTEATMPPQEFGPYRLDALLGQGSMGEVHRAYDSRTERDVALKLLSDRLGDDPQFRERFRRECHATARLREPHVIPIHQWGEIDGRLYLDMRLVDGEDLRATLLREGALPPERAVEIISQVARALDAAHGDDLVHRDVKPSNVLVTTDHGHDFVYLVDFGIAHSIEPALAEPLTGTGEMLGSINYIAPERFRQQYVDGRADVYSLTCVLFQCLTGRAPYAGGSLADTMHSHLAVAPPRPSVLRPDLPPEFDEVIERGMAKDPDQRYGSAGLLAAAARIAATPLHTERFVPVLSPPPPGPAPSYRPVDEPWPPHRPPPPRIEPPPLAHTRAPWWLMTGADLLLAAILVITAAVVLTRG